MSGGGSSRTTTTQELSPQQQQLLDLVIPAAEDISQNPPQLFPGSSIAGFNPLQEAGQAAAVNTAVNTLQPLAASTAAGAQSLQETAIPLGLSGLGATIGGLENAGPTRDFLLSGALLDPATNPVLAAQTEGAIRPLTNALTREVLPNVRREAISAGQFGGSRQGIAEGLALSDFTRQAGDIAANLQANNFNQGLSAMVNALDSTLGAGVAGADTAISEGVRALFSAPAIADLSLRPATVLEGVGSQQRSLEQAQLTEEADRFITEQIVPFLIAQDVANLAFGIPGGQSITGGQQGGSIGQDLLGIASIFSAFAPIMGISDRRVKHNIVRVGETVEGYSLYEFSYIGSNVRYRGVMADEVPEEITFELAGIKGVDYSKIEMGVTE